MHVFYLHGFASSPAAGKAGDFRRRLGALGIPLHSPDFNLPDFSSLTVTRMLRQLRDEMRALEPGPVALVGSSLGGFVALHAAHRNLGGITHPITHLVLLAPAVDFASGRDGWLSHEELEAWRTTGRREVFHFHDGRTYDLHYALYEDGHRYDAFDADIEVPALVIQGLNDSVVDPARVRDWCASRRTVTLTEVEDDHSLHGSLDVIWSQTASFLGLPAN